MNLLRRASRWFWCLNESARDFLLADSLKRDNERAGFDCLFAEFMEDSPRLRAGKVFCVKYFIAFGFGGIRQGRRGTS